MTPLIRYLQSTKRLPEDEKHRLARIFFSAGIEKDAFSLRQGELQTHAAFVVKGLFRYFYIDGRGDEHTKHFVAENDFLISLSAFLKQQPSLFFIQAIEDAVIFKIKSRDLAGLIKENPFWKDLYLSHLEKSYIIKEDRTADFLLKDATRRYLDFKARHPGLIRRLKRYHLASFLGIRPESLSRIKKSVT
jgi:CRP-like cAMP-binding protein